MWWIPTINVLLMVGWWLAMQHKGIPFAAYLFFNAPDSASYPWQIRQLQKQFKRESQWVLVLAVLLCVVLAISDFWLIFQLEINWWQAIIALVICSSCSYGDYFLVTRVLTMQYYRLRRKHFKAALVYFDPHRQPHNLK